MSGAIDAAKSAVDRQGPENAPIRPPGARHRARSRRDYEIYLALARLDIAIGPAHHYSLIIDFRPDDLDLLWRQSR